MIMNEKIIIGLLILIINLHEKRKYYNFAVIIYNNETKVKTLHLIHRMDFNEMCY